MSSDPRDTQELGHLFEVLFQAHPWHGVELGAHAPEVVTAYIEIVPTDPVKYELDKPSGHLRLDRPQRFSSLCPALYGFLPQTYCADEVARRCEARTGRKGLKGDGDPLDICVLTEKPIVHGNFLLRARPLGGLRMIDRDEADDKVIAVLDADLTYGAARDLSDIPQGIVDRLCHYFHSYKQMPNEAARQVEIAEVYDRDEAFAVIRASQADYRTKFGSPEDRLPRLRRLLSGP